jgi:hypothetical protein
MATAAAVSVAAALLAASPAGAWLTDRGRATATVSFDDDGLTTGVGTGAAGLYPGKVATGQVAVTNHTAVAAKVTSISAAASTAEGDCPASVVTSPGRTDPAGLVQLDGVTVAIPPSSTATYALDILMASDAPAACAGRSFGLAVEITGAGA